MTTYLNFMTTPIFNFARAILVETLHSTGFVLNFSLLHTPTLILVIRWIG